MPKFSLFCKVASLVKAQGFEIITSNQNGIFLRKFVSYNFKSLLVSVNSIQMVFSMEFWNTQFTFSMKGHMGEKEEKWLCEWIL